MHDFAGVRRRSKMRVVSCMLAVLVAAGAAGIAGAEEIDWKTDLKSGLQEAERSGRAVFLVTRWKQGV